MREFNTSQPIYQQLVQRICWQIIRGDIQAGEKLPSVREMGLINGVNPNTVQRSYGELERLQVVETRRGLGTFVSEDTTRLTELRDQLMYEQIKTFVSEMRQMGFTAEEIIEGVSKFLQHGIKEPG